MPSSVNRFQRIDHRFESQGNQCGAWLYLPKGITSPPVVIMAHGFGAQRWMRLPAYAERFAQRGMAVFIFDYRGFNDSDGQPRNYVNPSRHLVDWASAIRYVRTLSNVDGKRLALWGSSFSGGHVMVTAARDAGISAIIAQVPFTDGIPTLRQYRLSFQIKAVYHALLDVLAATFTKHRHLVKIVSEPTGDFGMMNTSDAWPGTLKLLDGHIDEFLRDNYCPANIALTLPLYRPIHYADRVSCPALIIGAEQDSLFPPDGPRKAASRMKKATYIGLPIGHFDPYVGEPFDKLVRQMADFLTASFRP